MGGGTGNMFVATSLTLEFGTKFVPVIAIIVSGLYRRTLPGVTDASVGTGFAGPVGAGDCHKSAKPFYNAGAAARFQLDPCVGELKIPVDDTCP